MKQRKPIGILGGMGPEASEYLYKLLIAKAIQNFGARQNDDFPEIVLQSIPVPDFISDDAARATALAMLQDRVVKLQALDLSCLSIACNTAHILLDDLKQVSAVSFVSMIDIVVEKIHQERRKTIGVLGTPSTIRYQLYQNKLVEKHIAVINPSEADLTILERVIRNVLAGSTIPEDKTALVTIANTMREAGAEGIILGCTELPLVFPKYKLPVYSSLDLLADALLARYYHAEKLS